MRYKIKLSYDGSAFCGWQIQPSDPSVQESLEKALSSLLGSRIAVTGAGRTDSKVNAIGYIAHFDAPEGLDTAQICYKLNAILPSSIAVSDLSEAPEEFHARFDARRREYSYFLHKTKDPFAASFSWQCGYPLDFDLMNRAAALLAGTHDFRCFEKVGTDTKTSICTVFEAGWHRYTPSHVSIMDAPAGEYWYFRIAADRFLRNMVRAVVGSLIEVGRGKRSLEEFASLILPEGTPVASSGLAARCRAGESVPGHALFLSKVEY